MRGTIAGSRVTGSRVAPVRRIRDVLPLPLDASYLPADVGRPLLGMDLARHDVFGLLEGGTRPAARRGGAVHRGGRRRPDGRRPPRVPDGFPLLFLERLTYTDEGRPIDLEFVRFRGDRTSLAGRLHRAPDPTHPLLNHRPSPERG